MSGEEEPPVVMDFRKNDAPRVDVFEKIAASPDYAVTMLDYIKRTRPETTLVWVREMFEAIPTNHSCPDPSECEIEIEGAGEQRHEPYDPDYKPTGVPNHVEVP